MKAWPRRAVAALFVALLASCSGDDREPGPDAVGLLACADIAGCESALCTAVGVCTCLRPGLEPVTCTNETR